MRVGNGFQPGAFQYNAFQMPDRVSGSGGLSTFWLAMFFQARRRQLEENQRKIKEQERKRRKEQEETETVSEPEMVMLRFLAVNPPVDLTAISKRMRANDDARALESFVKFLEAVALEEID